MRVPLSAPAWALLAAAAIVFIPGALAAQASRADSLGRAAQLDSDGKTGDARAIYQRLIETAPDATTRSVAQRSMAISYAYDGDCGNAVKYEDMVIAYHVTREKSAPDDAFFQQGEIANEAARICIDAGDLATAEKYYRRGWELGLREPTPKTHPAGLWDFRLAHALARLAARRGDASEAQKQVGIARRALDSDPVMAGGQERFFPYLVGYVALYTNDLPTAEAQLDKALAIQQNQSDPFMHTLLGMTLEKLGRKTEAMAHYQRAYELSASAHTTPSAFARPFTRKKLAAP